jgi:hypothetical protein
VPGQRISDLAAVGHLADDLCLVRQICTVPSLPAWRTVLAASSLTAITRSEIRGEASPARSARLAIKLRTEPRLSR